LLKDICVEETRLQLTLYNVVIHMKDDAGIDFLLKLNLSSVIKLENVEIEVLYKEIGLFALLSRELL